MTPTELMVFRKQQGLTQAEFGERLVPPVSRLTVSNWERARYAIPYDIAARMVTVISQPAKPSKAGNALTKATLEAYCEMRAAPNNFTHEYIVKMWHARGFTPSMEAQAAILAKFPELNPKKDD